MEKRCNFELFKSNVCHRLKESGDIDFLIETLGSGDFGESVHRSERSSKGFFRSRKNL